MKRSKLGPLAVLSAAQELRAGVSDRRPLAVAGAGEPVERLAAELRAGGDPTAVVEGTVEGAVAVVWVGEPDRAVMRAVLRSGVPLVHITDARRLLPAPASEVVACAPGERLPVDEVARALARRLGEHATALAGRLPVLRPAVCAELIRSFSRHNGLLAAAIFVPGVDLPVLTLNQVRLVLRLALAHGQRIDGRRALELLGVVGAGLGLRAAAREALGFVPVAGWAVKGAIAYTGTKALGEAAVRYFAARAA